MVIRMAATTEINQKNRDEIVRLKESGKTFGEIAEILDISRQRAFSLYHKEIKARTAKRVPSVPASEQVPTPASSKRSVVAG